jgi:membrane fusion protein (multidrug efflux system)
MRVIPRKGVGVLAAFAIIAVLAVPKILELRRSSAPSASAPAKRTLRVKSHRVDAGLLTERLATTGTVRANEEVELVSEISGKISSIHFEEGSRVTRGQLLLKIDDSELLAEQQRALHRVQLAERAEARQKQLLDDGVISSETYDVALGELNVLRAELQLIEAQLVKTEIRAPFSGVIGLRWVSPGSYLSSAVEGFDRTFPGKIYALEPSIDAATRSLRVRARCPNSDGALVPGAFANVDLVLRSVPDALTVPSIAVIPELGGKKVFVYEDGIAQPRPVETGIRSNTAVQITGGLTEGDIVIVSGLLQMRPGLEVEIEDTPGS